METWCISAEWSYLYFAWMPTDAKNASLPASPNDSPLPPRPALRVTPHGIDIPRPTPQILTKRIRDLHNPLHMLQPHGRLLMQRQRLRTPDQILDLPSIQLVAREHVELVLAEVRDGHLLAHHGDEHAPDGLLGAVRELAVAQGDVDAGLEGVVEGFDAVGGEEEDALEVLEEAEEDGDCGDSSVLVDVRKGAR